MKKMLILAMLCCCVAMLWAISPVKTTCQFEVRNDQGELVTSGNVNVKLSVMKGTQTGETVYVETHSCTANAAGRVAVTLGEGGGSPSWSSLSWANQTYFMKAEVQQGSSDYKEAGVLALTLSEEEDANVPINRFGSRVFLSNVALSGDYWDLTNKPVIPSSVAELTDAADYVTFDSLQRRFDDVEEELDRLRDTLHNLRSALGPMIEIADTMASDDNIYVLVDVVENGGSDISSATISAYLNADFSGIPIIASDVQLSGNSFSGNLSELNPNTTYYIKTIADNASKSAIANAVVTTDFGIPKLDENLTFTETKSSILVDGILEKTGGEDANVKLCAFLNADYSDTPICSADTLMTEAGNYSFLVDGLQQNTTYYLLVTSDNNHKQDTIRTSTSTLDISLTLNTNPSDSSVSLCGGDKYTVVYTAVLVGEEADTYEWSASGVEGVANGNTYTIEYTASGTYTVTCTAAGMTKSKQMIIANAGEAKIAICEKCDVNNVVIKSGSNCTSYNWYNVNDELVSTSSTGLTLSASTPVGIYRVVGTIASGCSTTRVVSLGKNTVHPCTVSNGLRAGTLLPNGLYANKEYGEGSRLDSVSDHEGNVYRVVDMDGKCWLAENMRATTSPSTGSTILLTTKYNSYCNKVACWYKHNQSSYGKYGVLYNWCAAVDTFNVNAGYTEIATANSTTYWNPTLAYPRRGVCPEGWHVPTKAEYKDLEAMFIVDSKGAGRVAGGCDWEGTSTDTKPNNYAYPERNITGFSILPSGYFYDGGFMFAGSITSFWSSTSYTTMHSIYRSLNNSSESFDEDYTDKRMGYAVRCLRNG